MKVEELREFLQSVWSNNVTGYASGDYIDFVKYGNNINFEVKLFKLATPHKLDAYLIHNIQMIEKHLNTSDILTHLWVDAVEFELYPNGVYQNVYIRLITYNKKFKKSLDKKNKTWWNKFFGKKK